MRSCPRAQHGPPHSDCIKRCLSLDEPLIPAGPRVLLEGVQERTLLYVFRGNLHK